MYVYASNAIKDISDVPIYVYRKKGHYNVYYTYDENHLLYLNERAYKLPYVDAEFQKILEKGGLVNAFS